MRKIENHMIIRPYHNKINYMNNIDKNISPQSENNSSNNHKEINLNGGNFNIIIQQPDELKSIEKELKELKEKDFKEIKEFKDFGPKINIKSKDKNTNVGITFNSSNKIDETSIMAIINKNSKGSDLSFTTSSEERMRISADGTIELNGDTILRGEQTIINSDILGTNNLLINNNITANGNLIVNSSALINDTVITSKLLIKEDDNKENIEKIDQNTFNYKIDKINTIIYNKINNDVENKEIGFKIEELQAICPYLVDNDNNVNYIGLIGILVNEIKNLKKEINILHSDNSKNNIETSQNSNNDLLGLDI